jgi:hypothetical protein
VIFNPRAWLGFARRLYAKPQLTSGIALAAAGVILGLLIRSGLNIVQILAVSLFVVLIMVSGIAPFAPRLFEWLEAQDMSEVIRQQWLYIAVWTALLSWGVYTLLD